MNTAVAEDRDRRIALGKELFAPSRLVFRSPNPKGQAVAPPVDDPERLRRILEIVEAYKPSHNLGDLAPVMTSLAAAGFDHVLGTAGRNAERKMDLLLSDYGARK